jgi:4a-hydroxytetrahydrobiopterin dehydratase
MKLLSTDQVDHILQQHPNWTLSQGQLTREWTFPGFAQAIAFVNQVAEFAEQANHHPDIDIRYNRVRLTLISHDARGLTLRDARMVAQIDPL